jgi:hypothetical protein
MTVPYSLDCPMATHWTANSTRTSIQTPAFEVNASWIEERAAFPRVFRQKVQFMAQMYF